MTTFQLENLTLQKGNQPIIRHLNWSPQIGEHWAIVGPNGSGKSTLLDALAGKLFPRQGKLRKPPADSVALIARDYRFHRIVDSAYQYYQQRFQSVGTADLPTVWEILQNQVKPVGTVDEQSVNLPPLAYEPAYLATQAKRFRIGNLLSRPVVTLSNGETRRTLIAYALLKQPKVVLLDNPFSGLDVESREGLRDLLNEVAQTTQIIMVSSADELPDCITHVLELQASGTFITHQRPFTSLPQPEVHKADISPIAALTAATAFKDFNHALAFRDTTVVYDNSRVVDRVNWVVKRGERWALIGPNGSGKSTLLSLVVGDNPQAYRNDFDLFDKKRGTGESIWDIKARIGYVSPELHWYFNRQIRAWKAVASGFFDTAGLFKQLTDEQTRILETYLRIFGLETVAERPLAELSTGEQRLVFLARALVKNPPLLILDEPCQGLDHNHMVYFRELVNSLVTTLNKTLIYVTHYEAEIPDCVTHRLEMYQGRGRVIY